MDTSLSLPFDNHIDIAPNEYVTKYSLNRNFERLLSNDNFLYEKYAIAQLDDEQAALYKIQTYNKEKTYDTGDFVFYKIQKSDTRFYILKCIHGPTTHKPTVRKNPITNDLFVVNSDWWVILGSRTSQKGDYLPKDAADMYVTDRKNLFDVEHQSNTEILSAHPTGKLGMQNSSKLFKTLENIKEDRRNFFYPNYLQSFVSDNTVYYGYMRKWDNGLLEYDLTFRLGYVSSDNAGIDILSANNVNVLHRNKNFMYFKDANDYKIFNRGGENYVVTPTTKQYNLNTQMNAYSGEIKFIEPFKDLNYMVFTSNTKSIETEAFNLKNIAIEGYDPRLVIDGRTITGYKQDAIFNTQCKIPNDVLNITTNALAWIDQVDSKPVDLLIDPWQSNLINIDNTAFTGTQIANINIPSSVRYIGKGAFSTCNTLTCVNFYMENDSSIPPKIDYKAFPLTVKQINIVIKNQTSGTNTAINGTGQSHERAFLDNRNLYDKLTNTVDGRDYREWIGFTRDDSEITINKQYLYGSTRQTMFSSMPTLAKSSAPTNVIDIEEIDGVSYSSNIVIDVEDLMGSIEQLQNSNASLKKGASPRMRFAAAKPTIWIDDVFKLNADNKISGFNDNGIIGDVAFDLMQMLKKPTGILAGALSNFTQLTGLTTNAELSAIEDDALPYSINQLNIRTSGNCSYNISTNIDIDILSIYLTDTKGFVLSCGGELVQVDNNQIYEFKTINNLIINAPGCTLLSDSFYINCVNNLSIIKPSIICSNAFANISSIANCQIIADSNNQMHIGGKKSSIFGHANNIYYMNGQLDLINSNKIVIDQYALSYIRTKTLSIDLSENSLELGALLSSYCNTLTLSNCTNTNSITSTTANFKSKSLSAFNAFQIYFPDKQLSTLSGTILNATVAISAKLGEDILIRGNDGNAMWTGSEFSNTTWLKLNSDNILTSLNYTTLKEAEELIIPAGIRGINANVFNYYMHNNLLSLHTIFIGSTITNIGASAFYGLSSLQNIIFEDNSQLTSIGKDAFNLNPGNLSTITVANNLTMLSV